MMRQTSLSSIRNNPLQRMAHRDQGQRGGARRQRQAATEGKPPRFRVSPSSGFASVRSAVSVGVLSILLLSASAAAQRVRDQRELLPGVPIERALGGGETHAYRIRLAAGQYLRVVVDQRGMDLVVSLIGPDGRQLAETNGFLEGNRGEEFVSLVAEASGNYRVEVQTLEKTAKPGRYEVRIEELREATPRDRTDVAAERAFAEGDRLYPEKPRMALEKYQRALSLFRAAGDRRGEATALSGIGEAYFLLDEKRKAIEVDRQALRLWRVLGDRRGEAGALIGLAVQYWMLGEYQKALDYDAEALEIQRVMGDRYGEANTIHNMALVYWFLGEHQQALDFYNQALVVFRDAGSRVWEAATLNHIGLVYQEMGEYQKALDSYNQALAVKPAIGSRAIETEALFYIGNVYASMGEYRKALENFRRVLPIFRTEGS